MLAFLPWISAAFAGNICDSTINYELDEVTSGAGGIGGTGLSPGGIGGTGHGNSGGMGGTGHEQNKGGMGGTGHSPSGGGIGGTGAKTSLLQGNSRVIGIVTGFASICVNGVEVHYASDTPVDHDGQSASTQQLQVGQLVSVAASGQGQEVNARRISILHALSGPVTKVEPAGGTVQVMGATIDISRAINARAGIQLGDQLQVSGLRQPNGVVHATRIDKVPPNTPQFAIRELIANGNGQGVPVKNLPTSDPQLLRIKGQWSGGAFQVKQMEMQAHESLSAGTAVHIQGYGLRQGNALQLQGLTIQTPPQRTRSDDKAKLLVVHGTVDAQGAVVAQRIEYIDERRVLERGGKAKQEKNEQKQSSSKHNNNDEDAARKNESSQDDQNEALIKVQAEAEKEQLKAQEALSKQAEDREKQAAELTQQSIKQNEDRLKNLQKQATDVQQTQTSGSGSSSRLMQTSPGGDAAASNIGAPSSAVNDSAGRLSGKQERSASTLSDSVSTDEKIQRTTVRDAAQKLENTSNNSRVDRPDKQPRTEKMERSERPVQADKIERVQRPERVERPDKVDKPDKVERPEKVERPDKVEKPEKVERSGKD